ncbi:hypothetical protein [Pelagicoccus sp. SDUM812002]|nr:hypothetical protein [Pelagicoccus sp. SDUM812002]MDQ8187997.1 hypothetical protein [Pelagicoccus sp. SDUM812002]
MTELDKKKQEPENAPVFGSWRRVYWFVALFFVVEVIAFYLFTQYYS